MNAGGELASWDCGKLAPARGAWLEGTRGRAGHPNVKACHCPSVLRVLCGSLAALSSLLNVRMSRPCIGRRPTVVGTWVGGEEEGRRMSRQSSLEWRWNKCDVCRVSRLDKVQKGCTVKPGKDHPCHEKQACVLPVYVCSRGW